MKDETNGTGLRLLNGPAADRWAVNCFLGGAMLYFVCAACAPATARWI